MESLDALSINPSTGTGGAMRPRILKAQFGDGYTQRSQDGPHSQLREWSVQYRNITKTKLGILDAFFTARAGYQKFLWTQPEPYAAEGQKSFVCEEWSFIYDGGEVVGLSATFKQEPLI